MTYTSTIDHLIAPLGAESLRAGDDDIRALVDQLDGRLYSVGDLKTSLQLNDHGLWLLCDGRNTIAQGAVSAAFFTLMQNLGFTGSDGTHCSVPDYRGRALVGLGTNLDVGALSPSGATGGKLANDGLAVAARTPKHRTAIGNRATGVSVANNTTGVNAYDSGQHAHQIGGGGNMPSFDATYHRFLGVASTAGGWQAAVADPGQWVGWTAASGGASANIGTSDPGHGHGINDPQHNHTGGPTDAAQRPTDTVPYGVVSIFVFCGKAGT